MLEKIFLEHPRTVNENYFGHFCIAVSFSIRLAYASIVCVIHAIFPCLFEKTASRMIATLFDEMVKHREKKTVHPGASY